jgi:hypothetical protein
MEEINRLVHKSIQLQNRIRILLNRYELEQNRQKRGRDDMTIEVRPDDESQDEPLPKFVRTRRIYGSGKK